MPFFDRLKYQDLQHWLQVISHLLASCVSPLSERLVCTIFVARSPNSFVVFIYTFSFGCLHCPELEKERNVDIWRFFVVSSLNWTPILVLTKYMQQGLMLRTDMKKKRVLMRLELGTVINKIGEGLRDHLQGDILFTFASYSCHSQLLTF